MTKKKPDRSYRQMKAELEEALTWFESDDIDIDEALEKYEHALKVTKELEMYLKEAENTLKKLT